MRYILALALALGLTCTASAQAPAVQQQKLHEIKQAYDAAEKLGAHIDVAKVQKALLEDAAKVHGEPLTYEELTELSTPPANFMQKVGGFFTFLNIIKVTAALLFVVAFMWLGGFYLLSLLVHVPGWVWEIICYGGCAGLIYLGSVIDPDFMLLPVLPGCFGLYGCLALTKALHNPKEPPNHALGNAICCAVWGAVAFWFDSQIVGFFAVMAFLSALGFSSFLGYGWIAIGFESDSATFRGTLAGFVLLAIHVTCQLMGVTGQENAWAGAYDVFRPGLNFMGTFVYFLGLLIMGSKWFWKWHFKAYDEKGGNWLLWYWLMQAIVIGSGVAALYLGTVFGMTMLLGVGGTFFYVYILEKYYEIPWKGVGWAWSTLFLAGILYGFVIFAQRNPQYFIFMN
jgi:hypothetical protein